MLSKWEFALNFSLLYPTARFLGQADLGTRRFFYKHHPSGQVTSRATAAPVEPNEGVDGLPGQANIFQDSPLGPLSRLHLCYQEVSGAFSFTRIP